MKSTYLLLLVLFFSFDLLAQKEDEKDTENKKFFKKENLFTGGTLNLSFGNEITVLGISPFFGYSINRYVDVAFSPSINYISQRDYSYDYSGDKLRQTIYGPGAFVRLFPLKFLFGQAQYEYNLIRFKYIPPSSTGLPNERYKYHASSFLLGGGISIGRSDEERSFYYISVLWDVNKDEHSPYIDYQRRAVPIFRAGYHIALFQGSADKGGRGSRRRRERY